MFSGWKQLGTVDVSLTATYDAKKYYHMRKVLKG
jgi:hypothetical protein